MTLRPRFLSSLSHQLLFLLFFYFLILPPFHPLSLLYLLLFFLLPDGLNTLRSKRLITRKEVSLKAGRHSDHRRPWVSACRPRSSRGPPSTQDGNIHENRNSTAEELSYCVKVSESPFSYPSVFCTLADDIIPQRHRLNNCSIHEQITSVVSRWSGWAGPGCTTTQGDSGLSGVGGVRCGDILPAPLPLLLSLVTRLTYPFPKSLLLS